MSGEMNAFTLRMWFKVSGKELCEYTIYDASEEGAIQKLVNGKIQGTSTSIDFEVIDHNKDLIDTISVTR